MSKFFGDIYYWFCSLYHTDLDIYLYEGTGEGASLYAVIGIITVILSLAVVLLYYYVFDHPKYSRWWSWLLTMLFNGVVSMLIAGGIALSDLNWGKMGDLAANIWPIDCWMFGFANMLVSFICFIIFTFIFKWWSAQAKHVPFF